MGSHLRVDEILDHIRSKNYSADQVLSMIESTKALQPDAIFYGLADAFRSEDQPIIRNRLAIALQDLGDRRALSYLIESVNDPITKGCRGTLIYAMSDLNPIEYVYELVSVVINDSLEASGNALDIIEDLEGELDELICIKSVQLIEQSLQTAPDEKIEDLEYLMEIFEQREKS